MSQGGSITSAEGSLNAKVIRGIPTLRDLMQLVERIDMLTHELEEKTARLRGLSDERIQSTS